MIIKRSIMYYDHWTPKDGDHILSFANSRRRVVFQSPNLIRVQHSTSTLWLALSYIYTLVCNTYTEVCYTYTVVCNIRILQFATQHLVLLISQCYSYNTTLYFAVCYDLYFYWALQLCSFIKWNCSILYSDQL